MAEAIRGFDSGFGLGFGAIRLPAAPRFAVSLLFSVLYSIRKGLILPFLAVFLQRFYPQCSRAYYLWFYYLIFNYLVYRCLTVGFPENIGV